MGFPVRIEGRGRGISLFSQWCLVGTGNGNRHHPGICHSGVLLPREAARAWDVVAHRRARFLEFSIKISGGLHSKIRVLWRTRVEDFTNLVFGSQIFDNCMFVMPVCVTMYVVCAGESCWEGAGGGGKDDTHTVWTYHATIDFLNLKNTPFRSICPGPLKSVRNSRISKILGLSIYLSVVPNLWLTVSTVTEHHPGVFGGSRRSHDWGLLLPQCVTRYPTLKPLANSTMSWNRFLAKYLCMPGTHFTTQSGNLTFWGRVVTTPTPPKSIVGHLQWRWLEAA